MKLRFIILFIAWLIVMALLSVFFEAFIKISLPGLAYAFLAFLFTRLLWAWNWKVLNKAEKLKHQYKILLGGTFVAGFTDSLTPPLLPSAELSSAAYLKKKFGGRISHYLPVLFLHSTLVVAAYIFLFVVISLFISAFLVNVHPAILVGSFFGAVLFIEIVFLLVFKRNLALNISHMLFSRFKDFDEAMAKTLLLFPRSKMLITRVFSVILVTVLIEASVLCFLLGAGPNVFPVVLLAFMGSHVMALFLFSPGGVGVYEVTLFAILSSVGISPSELLSAILIYRGVFFWLNVFLGGFIVETEIVDWVGDFFQEHSTLGAKFS